MFDLLPPPVAGQPRVLLVEDDPIQARVLTAFILRLGLCPLGPVASAAEALSLCQQSWPDLAILDIRLAGEIDGIELAHQLSKFGDLPLIFLSASDDAASLDRLRETQPLAFLPKPYRPEALQQIISQGLALNASLPLVGLGQLTSATVAHASTWLFVRERGALVRIAVQDIASVGMDQQYAILTLVSGKRYSVRLTLAEMLAYLPATDFVQSHRSWIVNLHHVEQVEPTADLVRLTGGSEVALGRAYRQQVLQHLRIIG